MLTIMVSKNSAQCLLRLKNNPMVTDLFMELQSRNNQQDFLSSWWWVNNYVKYCVIDFLSVNKIDRVLNYT